MELNIPGDQFVCVDYPCVVRNVGEMLNTLGGEKMVTKMYLEPSRRLELRFRPRDVYCKPACADRKPFSGLLLKIRRRKPSPLQEDLVKKVEPGAALEQDVVAGGTSAVSDEEIKAEILGVVDTMYSFTSMTDYQYLPMTRNKDGVYQSSLNDLVIDRLLPRSWLDEHSPLHMPPPIFTRYGKPVAYCFKEPPTTRDGIPVASLSSSIIGIARQRRSRFTVCFRFTHEHIPLEPYRQAVDKLAQLKIRAKSIDEVKELFKWRPIWTRSALRAHLPHLTRDEFQYILPTVSFYCQDGPWRTMWVRFGYDMRSDPKSKIFQNLDFRLRRTTPGVNSVIPAKRSTYEYYLPGTITKSQSQTSVIQKESFLANSNKGLKSSSSAKAEQLAKEAMYKFRPGVIPPSRQMFYHLCDVEEPVVQSLVHANDGKEVECSEKDGWCLPETVEKCRVILLKHLQKAFALKDAGGTAVNDDDMQNLSAGMEHDLVNSEGQEGADFSSGSSEDEEADEDEEEEDEYDDEEGNDMTADQNSD